MFFLRYHENNLRTISNDGLRKETKFDGKPKFRKFAKNWLPCSIVLVRAKIREWRCHLVILSGKRVTFSYFEERIKISLEMELSGIGAGLHLGNDEEEEEEEEADDADDDNDEDDDEASSLMMTMKMRMRRKMALMMIARGRKMMKWLELAYNANYITL